MFLFSCLTGLAYADMQSLYPRHIGQTAEGRSYIHKQRVKTRIEAFIPLHPIAEQILARYNRTDDTQPVFPLGPRDGIWHDIHQLGIIVGIRENLSYHQSRHSFGTLAISAGLSIESIAKMMGHANISTTQGYAQITEQRLSYSLRPVWEDATDEKEKNYERLHPVKGRLLVLSSRLLSVLLCCPRSAPRLPKIVAIPLLQHPLDIRGAVEDLAAQLDVGNPSLVAVILQTPAADLQPLRKLFVRIETLTIQRGFALRKQRLKCFGKTLQCLEVRADPLVMLRNQFIAHFPSV